MYYCNDPKFFVKIIGKENPPFEFKIHLFPSEAARKDHEAYNQSEGVEESAPIKMDIRSEKIKMMQYLEQFGAEDFNAGTIYDNRGSKLRFMFTVNDKEKALELYKSVS